MTGVDMEARTTSASRVIDASPEAIFELLTDPNRHPDLDGSGTVQKVRGKNPDRLELGSKFGMSMKLSLLPYMIGNTVVEYEENRLIAWQHVGKHRWRYELEPVEGGTLVTETFDWSTATSPMALEVVGYPERHLGNIERTLERIDAILAT